MNVFPEDRVTPTLWVVEAGTRWCDAARRFVGPFQHAETDAVISTPVLVQSIESGKVRAAIAGNPVTSILWEVSAENASAVALAIAQVGVTQGDVLQLVATEGKTPRGIEIRMMEFGVRAVMHRTEQFAALAPMVHRFFETRFADSADG
ncbi:MAG: hypothetical protein AAFX06_02580 [Planctomycetota bacterium]